MARTAFALFSGVFAMMIAITFTGLACVKLFPLPPGFDQHNPEAVAAAVAAMPLAAKLLVVSGWCLGAFAGGGVAARIAQQYRVGAALLIGALVVAGTLANASSVPHPLWMTAVGVVLPLPLAYLAARLVFRLPDRNSDSV